MNPDEALPLLEQMAEGLDAAHAAGVVHRDFKPSNVMLVPAGNGVRAVVTDFGLARRIATGADSTDSISKTIVGTLDYMAPELLTGSIASAGTDLYALGMVGYKMITGTLPFPAEMPLAGAIRRAKDPVVWPRTSVPELDSKWGRAILRALDIHPGDRFRSGNQFVQALRGETHSVTVRMPAMTRRRVAAAGLAALIVAGGVVGWRGWEAARNRPSAEAMRWYQAGVADLRDGAYYGAAKALRETVRVDPKFALAHARLAEALNELDDPEGARKEMLLALPAASGHVFSWETDSLYVEAIRDALTGDFPSAIQIYLKLSRLVPESERPQVLVDLGRARERNDEPTHALEAYREAARLDPQSAAAHLHAAILLGRLRKLDGAAAEFEKADSLYQALSNTEGQVEVAYQRGFLASTVSKLSEARAALEKAVQLAGAIGAGYYEIASGLQLSLVTYLEGDEPRAEQIASDATEKARQAGMSYLAARGLTDLGNAQYVKGDYSGAEASWNQALNLSRRFQMRRAEARALFSLANLHQFQGANEVAVKEAEPALAFFVKAGFRLETLQCLTVMARAHRDLGRYSEAAAEFNRLLELAGGVGDKGQMAVAEQGIASILFQEDHWPAALTHYEKYYELAKAIPSRDGIGRGLVNRANLLWRLGNHVGAEGALAEAGKLAGPAPTPGPLAAAIAGQRAAIALSQGLFREAIAQARKISAMTAATNPERVRSECIAGLAMARSGSPREGKRLCGTGFEGAAGGDTPGLSDTRLALSEILLADGEPQAALGQVRQTLETYEKTGQNESAWRAWVIAAEAYQRTGDQSRAKDAAAHASACLTALRADWGESDFRSYLKRPDIVSLQRALNRQAGGR